MGEGPSQTRWPEERFDKHEAAVRETRGRLEVRGAAEYVPPLPDLKTTLVLAEDIEKSLGKDQPTPLERIVTGFVFHPHDRIVDAS